jgi:glycosyltransferase involved in cell wall biosynthesis/2-polyprenyl-3-methyl-5-hydroxy-6-metoxy-1,4-benzoquinol methylase
MTARLRVGVDAQLARIAPGTGHGNVWRHLVDGLGERVDLVEYSGRSGSKMLGRRLGDYAARPIDVWLVDGHSSRSHPAGVASVAIAYDVRWADPQERRSVPVSFLSRVAPATEMAIRGSTLTAVPSEFAASGVRGLYDLDRDRIRVVPLGVDLALFASARDRHRLGTSSGPKILSNGDPYVLFVGSVEPRKNIGVLRDAMRFVASSGTRLRLAVRLSPAPGMDSRALLAAAIAPLHTGDGVLDEVIVLLPMSPTEMSDVISGATALCLQSTYEGFGLPALEAMAAGIPVVVADRGSLPEIVGDGAIVVEPEPAAIADALIQLVNETGIAQAIAARGFERAQTFSWEETVSGAYELLVEARAIGSIDRPCAPPRSWLVTEPVARCPVCGLQAVSSASGTPPAVTICGRCQTRHALKHLASDDEQPANAIATTPPGWPSYLTDPAMFEQFQLARAEQLLDIVERNSDLPGRLIDVRCDVGTLVAAAARRGWEATGIEPDAAIAALAAARVDGPRPQIVSHIDDVIGSFDVVVACDWLERAESATDALRAIRDRVAHGGRIVVTTPNWRSMARSWDGEQWHHLRPLESVTYFDRVTLRRAFEAAGMPDVHVECVTWISDDLTIAAHTLVPIRRLVLNRPRRPRPMVAAGLRWMLNLYDRCGVGDTLVAIAHVPPAADRPTLNTVTPGSR